MDLDSLNPYPDTDPDTAFNRIRIWLQSGSRVLMTKNWRRKKQLKKYFTFSWTKIASLGLHKGRPSYRRSLQLSKENIQHFKNEIYKLFLDSIWFTTLAVTYYDVGWWRRDERIQAWLPPHPPDLHSPGSAGGWDPGTPGWLIDSLIDWWIVCKYRGTRWWKDPGLTASPSARSTQL